VLKGYLTASDNTQRTLAVLALAGRGDKTLHDSLIQIISQSDEDYFRLQAVGALGLTATGKDVPLLKNLAKSDPYTRPATHPDDDGKFKPRYPVREAAQNVLEIIAHKKQATVDNPLNLH